MSRNYQTWFEGCEGFLLIKCMKFSSFNSNDYIQGHIFDQNAKKKTPKYLEELKAFIIKSRTQNQEVSVIYYFMTNFNKNGKSKKMKIWLKVTTYWLLVTNFCKTLAFSATLIVWYHHTYRYAVRFSCTLILI